MRERNLCFTIQHFSRKEIDELASWNQVTYLVYENTAPPLHGYVEFKTNTVLSTIEQKFPRTHMTKLTGCAKQAADCCKKSGDFVEIGEINNQEHEHERLFDLCASEISRSFNEIANTPLDEDTERFIEDYMESHDMSFLM